MKTIDRRCLPACRCSSPRCGGDDNDVRRDAAAPPVVDDDGARRGASTHRPRGAARVRRRRRGRRTSRSESCRSRRHTPRSLFAIGAGDQVVAVDDQSNYPAEVAAGTDLSGYEPNVEAIAGYEPDLVVTGTDRDLIAQLETSASPRGGPGRRSRSTTCTPRSSSSARSPGTSARRPSSSGRCRATSTRSSPVRRRRSAADLLPRARRHLLLGRLGHVHRPGLLARSGCRTSPTRPKATTGATRSSPPSSSSPPIRT